MGKEVRKYCDCGYEIYVRYPGRIPPRTILGKIIRFIGSIIGFVYKVITFVPKTLKSIFLPKIDENICPNCNTELPYEECIMIWD